jgi:thiamine biosynthesis protein ThiS
MQIFLNGTARETPSETVEALVHEFGWKRGMVLVEHNGVALRPDEWAATRLAADDRLEILRISAGG